MWNDEIGLKAFGAFHYYGFDGFHQPIADYYFRWVSSLDQNYLPLLGRRCGSIARAKQMTLISFEMDNFEDSSLLKFLDRITKSCTKKCGIDAGTENR